VIYINKKACRRALLEMAERRWPGKMTRVAENVFEHLDISVFAKMQEFVRFHPTVGKTLTTGTKPARRAAAAAVVPVEKEGNNLLDN
jgi:hypothetical protein